MHTNTALVSPFVFCNIGKCHWAISIRSSCARSHIHTEVTQIFKRLRTSCGLLLFISFAGFGVMAFGSHLILASKSTNCFYCDMNVLKWKRDSRTCFVANSFHSDNGARVQWTLAGWLVERILIHVSAIRLFFVSVWTIRVWNKWKSRNI